MVLLGHLVPSGADIRASLDLPGQGTAQPPALNTLLPELPSDLKVKTMILKFSWYP